MMNPFLFVVSLLFTLFSGNLCRAGHADLAKRKFEEGIQFLADGQYDQALAAFETSYAQRPKQQVLFNIAMCHQALFHYVKAIVAFKKLLAEGQSALDPSVLEKAQASLAMLLPLVGAIVLELDEVSDA